MDEREDVRKVRAAPHPVLSIMARTLVPSPHCWWAKTKRSCGWRVGLRVPVYAGTGFYIGMPYSTNGDVGTMQPVRDGLPQRICPANPITRRKMNTRRESSVVDPREPCWSVVAISRAGESSPRPHKSPFQPPTDGRERALPIRSDDGLACHPNESRPWHSRPTGPAEPCAFQPGGPAIRPVAYAAG